MRRLMVLKWCFLGALIVVLVFVAGSVYAPGGVTNVVKTVANSGFADKLRGLFENEATLEDALIEMVVESVGFSQMSYQPVVILKEEGGETRLAVWIGLQEANAISVVLEGVGVERPLTPDLLSSVIDTMGARVRYVAINDLYLDTFYASIVLYANWRQIEIDARPSDAIAIALRVRAPIYVWKSVLDRAGIRPSQEGR